MFSRVIKLLMLGNFVFKSLNNKGCNICLACEDSNNDKTTKKKKEKNIMIIFLQKGIKYVASESSIYPLCILREYYINSKDIYVLPLKLFSTIRKSSNTYLDQTNTHNLLTNLP
jgi:hypothetical protein